MQPQGSHHVITGAKPVLIDELPKWPDWASGAGSSSLSTIVYDAGMNSSGRTYAQRC
jgi:hypothetical protein